MVINAPDSRPHPEVSRAMEILDSRPANDYTRGASHRFHRGRGRGYNRYRGLPRTNSQNSSFGNNPETQRGTTSRQYEVEQNSTTMIQTSGDNESKENLPSTSGASQPTPGPDRSTHNLPRHEQSYQVGYQSRGIRRPTSHANHRNWRPRNQCQDFSTNDSTKPFHREQARPTAQSNRPRGVLHRRFMRDRNDIAHQSSNELVDTTEVAQSEISENKFKSNTYECMICCDNIHRSNPIWYCTNCYNIFHMRCAVEWCNKSIKTRDEAIANAQYPSLGDVLPSGSSSQTDVQSVSSNYPNYRAERQKSVEWPCPTCRKVLHSRPGKYKCFCGKVVQPEPYRHLTPHSCGQLCGRKRPSMDCTHPCDSLCHPGRCNPCQLIASKTCYCGKLSKEVSCSVKVGSCGQYCDKLLSCGRHNCTKKCHDGNCSSCDEILVIKCHCGSKEISRRCGDLNNPSKPNNTDANFSCDKICDKLLDCGMHRCTDRCHPGPECRSCPLLSRNLKTCPCGGKPIAASMLVSRVSCTDDVPTCDSKCNKQLICGAEKSRHKCQKKCHIGSCPPCKLKSKIKCECSMTMKTVDCLVMFEKCVIDKAQSVSFKQVKYTFKCETRCNNLKNCGKHRCQEKCCDASRNSRSRAHICTQTCNKKLPCGMHSCKEICHPGLCGDCTNIGWSELTCHCGASVLYPPTPCGAQPPACHMPCRRSHACEHPVKHECHLDIEKCAPCTVFVRKPCFCGTESKASVYCYLPGYSCGKICKKQLACRQHLCKRICHDGECESPNARGVILCSQPCPISRFVCKHACDLPCHGNTPCPATSCTKPIEIKCECGNRSERIECYRISKDSDNRNKMAMLTMNRSHQDSVVIDLSSKTSTSSKVNAGESDGPKKLDCDESCLIYKRNKALAEALDIAQPELKPTNILGDDPLKLIREATVRDYKFVAATYASLAKLVKSLKDSEKRFVFLQFPPADKFRREVIHELAYHFNCTSESRDDEPESELYTSVEELSRWPAAAKQFSSTIGNLIELGEAQIRQLKRLKTTLEGGLSSTMIDRDALEDGRMQHPVLAFVTINRLVRAIDNLSGLLDRESEVAASGNNNNNAIQDLIDDLKSHLPADDDLKGAGEALLRLQIFYDLDVGDLMYGRLGSSQRSQNSSDNKENEASQLNDHNSNGRKKSPHLVMRAEDCFEMGRIAFYNEQYSIAIQWLYKSLELCTRSDESIEDQLEEDINQENDKLLNNVLEYMAFSAYKLDLLKYSAKLTQTWLEREPQNERARENLEYYLSEIEMAEVEPVESSDKSQMFGSKFPTEASVQEALESAKATIAGGGSATAADADNDADDSSIYSLGDSFDTENYSIVEDKVVRDLCARSSLHHEPPRELTRRCHLKPDGIRVEVINEEPKIVRLYDVLTPSEAEHLRSIAADKLQRSTIHSSAGYHQTSDFRVAKTAWISSQLDPVVERLESRLSQSLDIHMEGSEDLQIVNYGLGGFYGPHLDSARSSRAQSKLAESEGGSIELVRNDRFATILIYLNQVGAGGSTVFPRLNVTVQPVERSAVVWFNLRQDGLSDERTLHTGCPVLLGSKWIATKWPREAANTFKRPCKRSRTGQAF